MKTNTKLTWAIMIAIALLSWFYVMSALTHRENPQDKSYYIEIQGESIYIMDGLGSPQAKVGLVSQHPDPEALEEVLETQIGWGSVLRASEAYYLILED